MKITRERSSAEGAVVTRGFHVKHSKMPQKSDSCYSKIIICYSFKHSVCTNNVQSKYFAIQIYWKKLFLGLGHSPGFKNGHTWIVRVTTGLGLHQIRDKF